MTMFHSLAALTLVSFQNQTERELRLEDVRERVARYVADAPEASYHFIIGTDSQGHRGYTKFATGVVIHRLGQGAWACYRQFSFPRQLTTIREKLMLETILSLEVARRFDPAELRGCRNPAVPFGKPGASASLLAYIDIDAGTVPQVNKTAECVQEMVGLVAVTGKYEPRVKPDAYAASSYANRHTKN
ncbi:ribonuclease H-like YkuK family protein [Cohnella panacarvi]|uniref:ribonuclease H-like YkuK family protein n=1 Tax=Cohnella panacarvi TaxID=400776 RepID=UPI00047A8DCD|nr:ribonuclease H-like YkuK family protein [Cohnella panacarvi]